MATLQGAQGRNNGSKTQENKRPPSPLCYATYGRRAGKVAKSAAGGGGSPGRSRTEGNACNEHTRADGSAAVVPLAADSPYARSRSAGKVAKATIVACVAARGASKISKVCVSKDSGAGRRLWRHNLTSPPRLLLLLPAPVTAAFLGSHSHLLARRFLLLALPSPPPSRQRTVARRGLAGRAAKGAKVGKAVAAGRRSSGGGRRGARVAHQVNQAGCTAEGQHDKRRQDNIEGRTKQAWTVAPLGTNPAHRPAWAPPSSAAGQSRRRRRQAGARWGWTHRNRRRRRRSSRPCGRGCHGAQ